MILGITGLKNSGKDTIGKYLVENYGFERKAFADKLKEFDAAIWNISLGQIEQWKNNPNVKVKIVSEQEGAYSVTHREFTFRHHLQRVGTEGGKEVFGGLFWFNQVFPPDDLGTYHAPNRGTVITDVRFEDETGVIRFMGGKILEAIRGSSDSEDRHLSELGKLQADYTIYNDGSFDMLYAQIDDVMEALGFLKK